MVKFKTMLVGVSLVVFAMASAYAQDDKKKAPDKDKAAATAQTKEKSKEASTSEKTAAGATAKKDEKKESK